jgi:hypothetical protein
MPMKFQSLASSTEDSDEQRRLALSDDAIETAARGKPMRAERKKASPATEVQTPVGEAVEGESSVAAPDNVTEDDPEATWVAEGGAVRPEEGDEVAGAKSGIADLANLAALAAGKVKKEDVKLESPQMAAANSILRGPRRDEAQSAADLDSLIRAAPGPRAAARGSSNESSTASAAASEQASPAAKPAIAATGAVAVPQAAQTVGDVIGQGIAGVMALPFLAATSARRHLQQKFGATASLAPPESRSAGLASGLPLAAYGTLERINSRKVETIEKSLKTLLSAAEAVRGIDGFPVWEDSVQKEANKRNVSPAQIVETMRSDVELAPLREQMTALWRENLATIENYRREADAFEKHIKDVKDKYTNSDEQTRERLLDAMKEVELKTGDLPGFDRQEGEYTATLAERIRGMIRAMVALVQAVMSRLTGGQKTESSPEISG